MLKKSLTFVIKKIIIKAEKEKGYETLIEEIRK